MEPDHPTKGRVRVRTAAGIKTTMNLPEEAIDAMRTLAVARKTTQAEVVRRALALDKYLHEARSEGGRVLVVVEDADKKTLRELVFF
jgi:hypothetical protein